MTRCCKKNEKRKKQQGTKFEEQKDLVSADCGCMYVANGCELLRWFSVIEHEGDGGGYRTVANCSFGFLFEACQFADDATVHDLLGVLNQRRDAYEKILKLYDFDGAMDEWEKCIKQDLGAPVGICTEICLRIVADKGKAIVDVVRATGEKVTNADEIFANMKLLRTLGVKVGGKVVFGQIVKGISVRVQVAREMFSSRTSEGVAKI